MHTLRIIYYFVASSICSIQVYQSLDKYFQHPIISHESSTSLNTFEKPAVQICFRDYYDYETKKYNHGYNWNSWLLSGRVPNSTIPTWIGIHRNTTFKSILNDLYEKDFSKIEVNTPHNPIFRFGRGFCYLTKGIGKKFKVTSREKNLRVYLVHSSTDSRIIYDELPIKFGPTSNEIFDYKIHKLLYKIKDNTILDGKDCVDYRKLDETYGDCNYRALKNHIYALYGCYPPWMEASDGKHCEVDVPTKDNKTIQQQVFNVFNTLTSGIMPESFQQCQKPCFQVKLSSSESWEAKSWKNNAILEIYNHAETVLVNKAVYGYDIFTLTVELGSALGLWLGKNMLFQIIKETLFLYMAIEK